MTTEEKKIQLVAGLDASGVKVGFNDIKTDAKDMAQAVVKAGEEAGRGVQGIGEKSQESAKKVDTATKNIIGSIQRATALMEAGERGSVKYYEALAAQKGISVDALRPYLTQLDQVREKQAAAAAALNTGAAGLDKVGMSAKATAAALRGVPAQFTDIITSLQGGQQPLTVLLQQGGQLKDMFGGIGPALRAMGGYLVGLINPFTLLAAAVGLTAVALSGGAKELREFQNAATISGNALSASASQFTGLRDSLQGIAGTKGKAAEVLTDIASNGKLAGDSVKGIAEAAILMEKATGLAVNKTVDHFVKLAEAPVTASLELNKQYNYLTAAVYSQIKALDEQGKAAQAAEVAERAFADTLKARATTVIQNVGLMEKAWRGLTGVAKGAWDAMLNIGREDSLADKLAKAAAEVARVQAQLAGAGTFGTTGGGAAVGGASAVRRAALEQEAVAVKRVQTELLRQSEIEQRNAAGVAEAERVRERTLQATVAFDKLKEESLTKQGKLKKEIEQAERDGLDAGKKRAEIEKVIASIRERYKESGAAGTGQSEVAGIRAKIKEQQDYLERLRAQALDPVSMGQSAKLTDGEKQVLKIQEELKTSITGVARAQKEKALIEAQALASVDKMVVAQERQNKGIKDAVEAYDKLVEATGKQADSIRQQAIDAEAANAAFGKSKTAIEGMALAQLQANLAEADSSDSFSPAYVAALAEKVKAQERYVAALTQTEIKQLQLSNSEWARVTAEEAKTLQMQAGLLGMTQLQREKIIGQRQVELELAKRIAEIDKASIPDADKARLRADAAATALIASNNAAAKAVQDEWQRTADQIGNGITDALMRGFESGKDFAANLRDTIVNMFKTMVLRPVIQATVQGGLSALGLGGGGGGIMDIANNASSLNSLFGAGSQALFGGAAGASTASLFGANAVGMAGGDALGSLIALNGQWAGVAAGASTAAEAAIAANLAMEAGTGVALASGTTAAAAGSGLAAAAGPLASMGPVGWAALAAVAVMSIFGDDIMGGERTNGTKGIEGNFSGSGFRGNSFQNFTVDGGWFGSDETGKDIGGLDAGTTQKFNQSYAAVQSAAAQAAVSLGLSADAIGNYSERISLTLTDDAAANEKAITDLFAGIGDRMAVAVAPGLTAFSKAGESAGATLARLSGSLTTANTWLSLLKQTLFDVSLMGGDTASKLADAFGGLDKLTTASKSFYETYYTETERAVRAQEDITKALATVNLAMPQTKDELRALAATLDLNTDAGRRAYAVLLSIAPEFAANADALARLASESANAIFKQFSDSAKVNYVGLSQALASVSAQTFAAAMELVFDDLAQRIKSVLDGIASQRTATANAALQINGPGVMTKDAIQRAIAATAVATPGNAGVVAAQAALGQADAKVAAQNAAVAQAKAQAPSTAALEAARAVLSQAKSATDAAQAGVDFFRGLGNGNFNYYLDQAFAGIDLRDTVPNPSGERNAQEVVFALRDAQAAQQPAQAAYDAALAAFSGAGAANSTLVAAAQAKLTEALAEQATAVAAARAAQVAYIASLQEFAIDANKAVAKLGELREETLRYYEAQKALSQLMATSAANLRQAMLGATVSTLSGAQNQRYQQGQFDQNYALATVSTGEALAGYADKLTQVIPGLTDSLRASSGTALEYALSVGAVNAQAANIAKALEAAASAGTYEADSLALLAQIDAALAVLQEGATSAEQVIAAAVKAGSDQTAAGLRAIIAALTGKAVPAFALGGNHAGGLRLVGEGGAELEATGPSRIWSASETRSMLSGPGDNAALVAELRAMREDHQAQARAVVQLQTKVVSILNRWDGAGLPEERVTA
jgi:hypothetical protein